LQRADENIATKKQNADLFADLHPEYLDTRQNGQAFSRTLKAMYGDVAYSVEQFENAYEVCNANGLLQLDQKVMAGQEAEAKAAARKQYADAERSRIVNRTEAELESMSLEEIRRLDAQERLHQMQGRGEEGGW